MNKFDFIFLIISSDNLECYKHMRNYIKKYFNLYKNQIKYFFIELKNDLDCDICEKDDYIYVKGEECITPGMYIKTIKSMQYINENYNYDFIIRTNLSSFWNLDNLLILKQQFSLSNFCGGYIIFNEFITGTGLILSKDVCINLSKNLIIVYEFEDVYLSKLLRQLGYSLTNITQYRIEYLINDINNINHISDINNILYYRIKNNDRNIDIELFDILYTSIYNK
jgi:hypothetical protein